MIKYLFHDIDETHIHSSTIEPNQDHISFEIDGTTYYTIVRPCAKRLIEFSRELVGPENVFILTTSIREYAQKVNELALFGFRNDQILAREDINAHHYETAYGGSVTVAHKLADPNNVLIDNLPPQCNESKSSLIGIDGARYFHCRDYYGVNFPNDPFEEDVKEFLTSLHCK
jgi:hypothetical protein